MCRHTSAIRQPNTASPWKMAALRIFGAPQTTAQKKGARRCAQTRKESCNRARNMVRAEGLEPSQRYPQRIFVPATAFAAAKPGLMSLGVCGLDYPFTAAASA